MVKFNIFVLCVLLVGANCKHIYEDFRGPYLVLEDDHNAEVYLEDDLAEDWPQSHPGYSPRVRRQAHGSMGSNSDGSSNFAAKIPLAGNNKNILSAVGSVGGPSGKDSFKAFGGGLALDNVNGHGASVTGTRIPGFGDQLTGAGRANLFHNDKHDVTANAFATRTFPNNPNIPNFNTYGGNVGYTYDNKVGATLGMAHTDLFKKTDYSAMGNLNLFRDRGSSLDFNAGMSKSVSPFLPKSRWEPSGGFSFTRFF